MTTRNGLTMMPNQLYCVAYAPTNNLTNFRDGTTQITKVISQCLRKSF